MQHLQNTASDAEPAVNHYFQHREIDSGLVSRECNKTVLSHPGGSSGHSQRVPSRSIDKRIDEDSGYDGGEVRRSDVDADRLKDDEIEMSYAEMPLTEAKSRMNYPNPEVRRGAMRYREQDRIDLKMLAWRHSAAEVILASANNQARLQSGPKRANWEIIKDDEVKEMHGRRVKRTKTGGCATRSTRRALAECQENLQPLSKSEYKRQGALANTSHHPATRPTGSAVQKLHENRLRRHAAKGTQKYSPGFGYYPQPEIDVYASYYSALSATGEPQSRLSSHRQRQAGSVRTNPTLNPAVENTAGDTQSHVSHSAPESNESNDPEDQLDPGEVAQNDAHTAPRRQCQQPAAITVRDDLYFSDELFNGMLNGQPNNNHVGSMYARSHQREIDEYFQRVTNPRPGLEPESDTLKNRMPSSPRQHVIPNIPGARTHGTNAPPVAQASTGALRLARASINDLDLGNIADWNSAWSSFVNDHDCEYLLRGHYPDENK